MTALPQHMQHLASANVVRLHIAQVRRDVAAMSSADGAEFVASALEDLRDGDALGAISVDRLLLFVRGFGEDKMVRCLAGAGVVNTRRRLRELTSRQREVVAAQLRLWAAGYGS